MKKVLLLFVLIFQLGEAQENSAKFTSEELAASPLLNGTLYTPAHASAKTDIVIIIAGSGPTDRNGNQKGMTNNTLKLLAESFAENNIAAYSYDKRIIAQMKAGTIDEKLLSFQDLINDARLVFDYFKTGNKYRNIIIAGHSEGSLVGMVASQVGADAFISISGAGRSIDLVIEDQLKGQTQQTKDEAHSYFILMKEGKTFELKNPALAPLLRESVQPYMISWIKFNPQTEIQKLKIPVLILNGTKDLQAKTTEAELLAKANPKAKLFLIDNMNHVLKDVAGDDNENMAAYNNAELPLNKKLVSTAINFVKSL